MEIVASTTSSSSVGGDELLTKAINLSDDEFNLILIVIMSVRESDQVKKTSQRYAEQSDGNDMDEEVNFYQAHEDSEVPLRS